VKFPTLLLAAIIAPIFTAIFFGTPSFAQEVPSHNPLTDEDAYPQPPGIPTMQRYLAQRPELLHQLRTQPGVVNDPTFLDNQPRIKLFLKDHPDIAETVKQNPSAFLQRSFEGQPPLERGRNPDFQDYLDHYPADAILLRKNPDLLKDPKFVRSRPELDEYLADHPEAVDTLKQNPDRLIHKAPD